MDNQFEVTNGSTGAPVVVRAGGEIDVATAPALRDQLNDLIDDGHTNVAVDLREVEFLDSTGIGVLVGGQKRCRQDGGSLRLIIDSARILRLFEITGLTDFFEIVDEL